MKRLKIVLALAWLAILTGCAGYVDGGGVVVAPEPVFYGGFWGPGPGRFAHAFHDRGFHSRQMAHGRR